MRWYLDFGHGGRDSGAVGFKGSKESDAVLKIGMLVKGRLERALEEVVTTRCDDSYYSLDARSSKANSCKCDYFVSIHMNASSNRSAKGCEVWVYDKGSKVYSLAKDICDGLSRCLGTPNRGVKVSKEFSVLRKSSMPALLVEVDFISNGEVEDALMAGGYVEAVADSISGCLLDFVGKGMVCEYGLYRVCVGAYRDRSNAVRVLDEAISKGFGDSYIVRG